MKNRIQLRALELGFDACGITSAEPPTSAAQFRRWLAAKHHGEMAYLERNANRRINPQEVLAGAKSIITLATSYWKIPERPEINRILSDASPGSLETNSRLQPPLTGVVARYARFKDYHEVLAEPLKLLAQNVNDCGGPGARSLWYVDTGPLLERDLAQRSGLGFIGKHTNLISRKLGNWFYLSEIITTVPLDADPSEINRCGTCARCMDACPTQAITAPFELDARRCISYLTIELKGSIPMEFRKAMGSRIFGCDDCLAVCPWNRFAREGRSMRQHARPDLSAPELLELLKLDDVSFKRQFGGTPIMRAKRRGLLRNVCVALGNVGDEKALPLLEKATRDAEPLIAEHAGWAKEQIEARIAGKERLTPLPGAAP